jgi:hypothetical protein
MDRDIDKIIKNVKDRIPNVEVSQLKVSYPGVDDDGLWYFELPGDNRDIQIESPYGQCPFTIEHNEMKRSSDAWIGQTVDEVVEKVTSYLLSLKGRPNLVKKVIRKIPHPP